MLIARQKEIAILTRSIESDQAEFLIVYGRRRIGKTYLIKTFFEKIPCVFFRVTGIQNGKLREHLEEFSKEIGRVFYGGAKVETPGNWMRAFEALTNAVEFQKSNEPVILFMDEFPWMATPRSRLLQALEYYWNRFWNDNKKIKLIICGSSASWIVKKIIHNKGGLHNRITNRIQLAPFSLSETKQFLTHKTFKLSNQQIMEIYFVLGGVPYYLNQLNKNLSVSENINELCFQTSSPLFNEFEKLLASLFKKPEKYEEIIRIISQNRHGTSRSIIEKKIRLNDKGGALTGYLKDLETVGFIKSFLPIENAKRGTFYRITDEYLIFYLQWIEVEKNNIELEIQDGNYWLQLIQLPRFQSWRGYAFESVCYKHVSHIKNALKIKVASKIGAWRYVPRDNKNNQGAQIDLLFDRSDDAISVCEIKYSDKPFVIDKSYAAALNNRIDIFKSITRTKKQIFLCMITASGLHKNKYASELVSATVEINDFFNE